MARRRFFVEEVRNGTAAIEGDEAQHLTRVLRVERGQKFEISDNARVWLAEVAEARKALVEFRVLEELPAEDSSAPVTLYAALFKFDRFEWMVEKVTELGVRRIVPVETARSDRGLFEAAAKRVERWRRVSREASQQSRRSRLLEIDGAVRLAHVRAEGVKFMLDEERSAPRLALGSAVVEASLFVGPEGGWTDDERNQMESAGWRRWSLGPTILRAETAAIAGCAVLIDRLQT